MSMKKRPTERQRQWLWFAALWCGGLAAALALSYVWRWVVFHM
jgi:hypothetical protein